MAEKIIKSAGRVAPFFMGDYDNTTEYRRLDWVYYGGTSYICKKNNTLGIFPSNTDSWQKIIESPIELNMNFDEANERENILNGDRLSVILGKIKKWFSDLKPVAFSGKASDLSDIDNYLKNTGDASNTTVGKVEPKNPSLHSTDSDGKIYPYFGNGGMSLIDHFQYIIDAFKSLAKIATTGKYSDLSERLTLTNNLLANKSGTALDAEQGKILKDKDDSLQNQINTLNSDLSDNKNKVTISWGNNDLDAFIGSGLMWTITETVNGDNINVLHAPAWGCFLVLSLSEYKGTRSAQIAIQVYSSYAASKGGDTYIRTKHDTTWSLWRKLAMES